MNFCVSPLPLSTQEEEEEGRAGGLSLSPSWVLLDRYTYLSADSVSNSTTAVGQMSTGKPIHFSICLGRPPLLSYVCAHFPGPVFGPTVGTVFGPPSGTPAVLCVKVPPVVLCTHAGLALLRVTIPGAWGTNDTSSFDYFVYTARPRPGASSLDLLPRPTVQPRFRDGDVAILRCSGGSRYVIAVLRTTMNRGHFELQRYDSDTVSWTMTPLCLHQPETERDRVLPIPDSATETFFHNTTKVVVLGSGTVGWVDLWRGILFYDVLDENPVLRDMPLPKPARRNRSSFCMGGAFGHRDITVLTIPETEEVKIKYVEMEFRPGVVTSPQCRQPMDLSGSGSDGEGDFDVAPYWTATVWSMPVPITSWNDWHKDCTIDVADTIVQNPRHREVLLALPTRLGTDPEDAAVSLRRLETACPTLGPGKDGNLAIYFLSKVDRRSPEGWVIEVSVRDNKLQGIAKLDDRKNRSLRRYYCITDISKHLARATDMSLPKPARSNRSSFCIGGAFGHRDITVLTIPETEEVKIKYVEMEFRPGVVTSPQRRQSMDHSGSGSDGEDDFAVAPYWTATVWSMPVPITSRSDWHKDCTIDVADTIVQNPRHREVLLALPTRLGTDPEDAAVSLRRLETAYPTLGPDRDGNLAI